MLENNNIKYIRTEEGIFQVGKKNIVEPNNNPNVSIFPNESGYYITRKNQFDGIDFRYVNESSVIKEGNSILELCDEFVYNNELLCPMYISPKEPLIESWKNRLDDEFNYKNHKEIYGAIWTERGLIFVAKVNENNELELLE